MKNNYFPEIISALVLITVLVLLINPLHIWMPNAFTMSLLGVALVVFGIFTVFMLREQPQDEREALHRLLAGRIAFLIGAGILMMGIVIQMFAHQLDIWLPATLGGMVLAKIVGLVYSKFRN